MGYVCGSLSAVCLEACGLCVWQTTCRCCTLVVHVAGRIRVCGGSWGSLGAVCTVITSTLWDVACDTCMCIFVPIG